MHTVLPVREVPTVAVKKKVAFCFIMSNRQIECWQFDELMDNGFMGELLTSRPVFSNVVLSSGRITPNL